VNGLDLDQSPSRLVSAIEDETAALYARMRGWPGATVHDAPDLGWVLTHVRSPMFNGVYRTRLDSGQADAAIAALVAEARAREVPLLWWVMPGTQPADLSTRLEAQGFVLADHRTGMALDLSTVCEDVPALPGLEISPVRIGATLRLWTQVHAQGDGWPEPVAEASMEVFSRWDRSGYAAWLGWLDGRPVATSLLLCTETVAGVNFIATLPEARRRGIGTAMVLAVLREARERGYRIAVLTASDKGAGIYRSLGFRDCCRIAMYVWTPDKEG
jgi:GNAT superfamily N-acetyltransferase